MNNEGLKLLHGVFGAPAPKQESANTANVLVIPSGIQKDLATKAIESIDLGPIFRDLGVIVAREIATALEQMALRPADYTELPDLAHHISKRLAEHLQKTPEEFLVSLIETLKMKG